MSSSSSFLRRSQRSTSAFPLEFDADYYRRQNADLQRLSEIELTHHYGSVGVEEGRRASEAADRGAFLHLIDTAKSVLEIGPFANPALRGESIEYFDVLTTEELRKKAAAHNLDPAKCPAIHFVSTTGDLTIVPKKFDAVFSSHVIEHQPDLVKHLQDAAGLLASGGHYFLAVPDKRYCFDYFIAESSIADVLDAHMRENRFHDVRSVIEHLALTTHNDSARHWEGDHGEPRYLSARGAIRGALNEYMYKAPGTYIDTHAWQFTPASFRTILQSLFDLDISSLSVQRIYATIRGSNEFYAILQKVDKAIAPLRQGLPADFNEELYLRANPDVAAAGMNAAAHYLQFGRSEGRQIR
jgi:SAM-dependent methyltransferase